MKVISKATEELLTHLKLCAMPMPILEHKFHPTRKWRMDMAYIEDKIAIEIHGAVYTQGRHTRGKGFTNDREKMNEAQLLGWIVLEITQEHITKGLAAQWIEKALELRS